MRIRRLKRAFTLVELMVVVAILGILATVVVVNVSGRTGEAKRARAKTDFAAFKTAIRLYKIDTGRYPQALQGLLQQDAKGKGPWIEELAKDPWDNDYYYEYRGRGKFVITSFGADGQPGGEEEDADVSTDDQNQN